MQAPLSTTDLLQTFSRQCARYSITGEKAAHLGAMEAMRQVKDNEIRSFLASTPLLNHLEWQARAPEDGDERVLVHPYEQFVDAKMSKETVDKEWRNRIDTLKLIMREAENAGREVQDRLLKRMRYFQKMASMTGGLDIPGKPRIDFAYPVRVRTIVDLRLPFDGCILRHGVPIVAPRTAKEYSVYLKDIKASCGDLLFVLLNIHWTGDRTEEQQSMLNQIAQYDREQHTGTREKKPILRAYNWGNAGRNLHASLSIDHLQSLIETFFVVRLSDINKERHRHLAAFFTNNFCRSFTSRNELSPGLIGPLIRRSSIPKAGQGLFARRAYRKRETVCPYGGVQMSQDVNYSFKTDAEMRTYGSAYTFGLGNGKNDSELDDWIIDGKLFWMLHETGRFVNQAADATQVNCVITRFQSANLPMSCHKMASSTTLVITASREIKAGEEFLTNYGKDFHEAFLPPGFVRFSTFECLACELAPAVMHCERKCKALLYCSQICAEKHWDIHKRYCKDQVL